MATFDIHCEAPWFSLIKKGIKPVEGRKATHSYKKIRIGDHINFTNGSESFVALVTEIRSYASLEEYFADIGLEKALPGVQSIEEGRNIYLQWSTEDQIKQYGFLGIFIKPEV